MCDEVMANYLPDWRAPRNTVGSPACPFSGVRRFTGPMAGSAAEWRCQLRIQLDIESDQTATLAIGTDRAEAINWIRAEGEAFTGMSTV